MGWLAMHDPGNAYAIPYMWASAGLGYDVDKVRARLGPNIPDSWSLLFDPGNAAKLADCGIEMIDAPSDVFDSVIIYLGRDPNRFDPADITAAAEVLRKIRPFVRSIDTMQYFGDLAQGNACLILGWSGDIGQARRRAAESKTGVNLAYLLPREGSAVTVDMMAIPKDAPHPHNAEVWMNYVMRPDVIAGVTSFIKYPNGNLASLPYWTRRPETIRRSIPTRRRARNSSAPRRSPWSTRACSPGSGRDFAPGTDRSRLLERKDANPLLLAQKADTSAVFRNVSGLTPQRDRSF